MNTYSLIPYLFKINQELKLSTCRFIKLFFLLCTVKMPLQLLHLFLFHIVSKKEPIMGDFNFEPYPVYVVFILRQSFSLKSTIARCVQISRILEFI